MFHTKQRGCGALNNSGWKANLETFLRITMAFLSIASLHNTSKLTLLHYADPGQSSASADADILDVLEVLISAVVAHSAFIGGCGRCENRSAELLQIFASLVSSAVEEVTLQKNAKGTNMVNNCGK